MSQRPWSGSPETDPMRQSQMNQGYRPSPTGGGMFMQPQQQQKQGGGFWRGLGNALKAPFTGGEQTTNNYYGGQQGGAGQMNRPWGSSIVPPMRGGGWGGTPYGQGQLPGGYKPPMGSRPDMMPPGSTPSPNMPRSVPSEQMPPWARNPPPWMNQGGMNRQPPPYGQRQVTDPNAPFYDRGWGGGNQGPLQPAIPEQPQGGIGPTGNLQDMFARMQQQDPNYQQPEMVNNGWGKMIPREQAEAFRRGGGIA